MTSLYRAQKRLMRKKYGCKPSFTVQQKASLSNTLLSIIAGVFIIWAYAWMSTDDYNEQMRAEQRQAAHEKAQRLRDQGLLDDATAMASPLTEDK